MVTRQVKLAVNDGLIATEHLSLYENIFFVKAQEMEFFQF